MGKYRVESLLGIGRVMARSNALAPYVLVLLACSSDPREVEVAQDASVGGSGGQAGAVSGGTGGAGGATGGTGGAGGATGGTGGTGGATGGTGGGAGAAGAGGTGTLGESCSPNGALACAGHAQKTQLVCNGTWQTLNVCSGSNNCDTSGTNLGSCQPIVSECVGKAAGYAFCSGGNVVQCGLDLVTTDPVATCTNQACVSGACTACQPGAKQCNGLVPQTCDAGGQWQNGSTCQYVCSSGACTGVCTPGATQCSGNGVQTCSATGQWGTAVACTNQACVSGACTGVCTPGATQCSGNGVQTCSASGQWGTAATCQYVCSSGACTGVCTPGAKQCSGNGVQTCSATGQWGTAVACGWPTPACASLTGTCVAPPSCEGLASNCGASSNDSCCTSPLVTGGTYNRSNDASYPATVSSFRLDKYEVTVGRFRKFVDAVVAGWLPGAGSGKHTHLNGGSGLSNNSGSSSYEPGWDTAWNTHLHGSKATWDGSTSLACNSTYRTWTTSPGSTTVERRPINCVNWYQAHAFCIWDGGFLPSEAEWNYAAAGGSEQRLYPWGATAPGANANLAVYDCYYNGSGPGTCTGGVTHIAPVGAVPAGDGLYGQSDLAGNVFEWNLDWYVNPYATPCNNCAYLPASSSYRVRRGGGFNYDASRLLSSNRGNYAPTYRGNGIGARCARTP